MVVIQSAEHGGKHAYLRRVFGAATPHMLYSLFRPTGATVGVAGHPDEEGVGFSEGHLQPLSTK